jgi:hypothetical protein
MEIKNLLFRKEICKVNDMKTELKRKKPQELGNVTGQIFYLAFQNLANTEKKQFLTILATDKKLMQDLFDISVIEQRRKEPSRSFRDILKELNV